MAKERLNGYELSRYWFDWCFENPEKINPNHSALYFFAIEHCNRLGWKEKFGLPTTMTKEAIGIKSYNTYINTLNDLINWGFIILIEKSRNQHSSNIVALSKNNKALDKALDKALIKHTTKQSESTSESNCSILKQDNQEQYNNITDIKENNDFVIPTRNECGEYFKEKDYAYDLGTQFFDYYDILNWINKDGKPVQNWKLTAVKVWFPKAEKKTFNGKTKLSTI